MNWLESKTVDFLKIVDDLKEKKAFPFLRPFENIGPRVKIGNKSYINFTSNDYLGLSQHPRLIKNAIEGTAQYGTGLGSSRLQASTGRHDLLEQNLARWVGYPACAVFATGYQSVLGTITAYLDGECMVVMDQFCHASITDAVNLAKGANPNLEVRVFKHNSANGLRRILSQTDREKVLVIVEGLYGADGDLSPLDEIVKVCQEFKAAIFVDDAHGFGSIGATGRGVAEHFGVLGEVDLLMGSFSKSFGTVGGFILGSQPVIDYLKLSAKSFTFSASLPLAQVEAALTSLDMMSHDFTRIRKLEENTRYFREGLKKLGFNLGDSVGHISPLMIGDEEKTVTFAAYLFHGAGIIMLPFVYPGVPKGKARLRCNVTAAHAKADMAYALEAVSVIGKELGLIDRRVTTGASDFKKIIWTAESKLRGVKNAGLGYAAQELKENAPKIRDWIKEKIDGRKTTDQSFDSTATYSEESTPTTKVNGVNHFASHNDNMKPMVVTATNKNGTASTEPTSI